MTTPAAGAEPRSPAIWEDFVDIFTSPSAVFARRRGGGFGIPLVVLTLLLTALYLGTKPLLQPALDAEFARQAARVTEANPQVTAEQLQAGRKFADNFGFLVVLISTPIQVMLTGIVLWLVGKVFDSQQAVRDALMVASYAFFPRLLGAVVSALIASFTDPAQLTSVLKTTVGVGRFLNPGTTSPLLIALLSRLDVFTTWVTVLLAIGLHVTGRVPKARACAAGAIVWVLGALPGVLEAMRQR